MCAWLAFVNPVAEIVGVISVLPESVSVPARVAAVPLAGGPVKVTPLGIVRTPVDAVIPNPLILVWLARATAMFAVGRTPVTFVVKSMVEFVMSALTIAEHVGTLAPLPCGRVLAAHCAVAAGALPAPPP